MPGMLVLLIPWIGVYCVSPPNTRANVLKVVFSTSSFRVELEKRVAESFGHKITDTSDVSEGLILYFGEPAVYLNWTRIQQLQIDGERVKRAIRDAAKKLTGISDAFTNTQLLEPNKNASELEMAVRRSFRADRSGDVLMNLKSGYIWNVSGTGTTHGQAIEIDQHVPLMFWGRDITPGHYDERASPTDIARTIGELLGFRAGGDDTRVLPCVESLVHAH